ncbi:MAG: phospholipase D-like domain-containing protein [Candidatus Hermodarchaeota archaeon]
MLNRVYVYLFIVTLISCVLSSLPTSHDSINNNNIPLTVKEPLISQAYIPSFNATNIKEIMTISPMFTPDNALDIHVGWINRANTSIILQNQYITKFDSGDWISDSNPLVRALVAAHNRSINIRVQVREDSDSDDITSYFNNLGIDIRWMGSQDNNPDNDWLSSTHNKLIVVDDKVTLLSSINFGENAFTENREAGFAIINTNVANYFTAIFNRDWNDGVDPSNTIPIKPKGKFVGKPDDKENFIASSYPSHTNIPKTNFTGIYNMTLFTNPDSADETIFKYLLSAKESIYVSMYTISRPDFNNTLIDLKKNNPNIDIQVLISNRRFGESENIDTKNAAISLVNNLIPVYNSTTDADKVNGYYHAKYWIIDGKHVFVYSGNWSPRSVTPQKNEYTSN